MRRRPNARRRAAGGRSRYLRNLTDSRHIGLGDIESPDRGAVCMTRKSESSAWRLAATIRGARVPSVALAKAIRLCEPHQFSALARAVASIYASRPQLFPVRYPLTLDEFRRSRGPQGVTLSRAIRWSAAFLSTEGDRLTQYVALKEAF